jgi:2',3'-cyclic-nucleotide 2'-phosphodiesterase (5'-nucleotidase family)
MVIGDEDLDYDNGKRRRNHSFYYVLHHCYGRRVKYISIAVVMFVLFTIVQSLSSFQLIIFSSANGNEIRSLRKQPKTILLNLTNTPLWKSLLWKSLLQGENEGKPDGNKNTTSSVTIVLTGDVHGHVMHSCSGNVCYPGAPHISTVLQVIRRTTPHVWVLDAGDAGSENPELAAKAMNYLNYTAMALGNHELDLGYANVQHFLKQLRNIPVLAANLQGLPGISSSLRLYVDNDIICIIGLTVQEFNPLAGPNVQIQDVRTSLEQALTEEQLHEFKNTTPTCTKTIVLSHAGLKTDQELAMEFPQVDIILGGHSHVISGTGVTQPESTEFGLLADPTTNARILHTGANGRFVGLMQLEWDKTTKETTSLQSEVLPLDAEHGVDSDKEMEQWLQAQLVHEENGSQRQPKIQIDIKRTGRVCARPCRKEDCSLGQVVTDAMRACLQNGPCRIDLATESFPVVALLESGTLRNCLLSTDTNFGIVLPWPNKLVVLQLKGSILKEFLQHGLDNRLNGEGGAFLQVAGIHYHYQDTHLESVLLDPRSIGRAGTYASRKFYLDPNQQPMLEWCKVQRHENNLRMELDDSSTYHVVVTDWLSMGGDGYGNLVQKADAVHTTNVTLQDAIASHSTSLPRITYGKSHQRSWASDDELRLAKAAKNGISGFFGGAAAFWITFPLYTLFVRKSMGTHPRRHRHFSSSWRRLWDGAWVGTVASAVTDAVYFMVYSYSSLVVVGGVGKSSVAAVVNSVVTTPLWVIVTHKQLQNRSIISIAETVYKDKGLLGFFDSLPLNLMMCTYPIVRQVALELVLGFVSNVAIAATLASAVGTVITYPIQKWRIQLQSGERTDASSVLQLPTIYKGVDYKLMDTCVKTFILFLVKEQSDVMLCILDG